MQFTSTIILALLLAVSTSSTVTAAKKSSNLRSGGRKLHEDNELNHRELGGPCGGAAFTIQSGDTCGAIHNTLTCGDWWTSLECVQAGKTCTEGPEGEITKLFAGDSCIVSNGCKIGETGVPDGKRASSCSYSVCGGPGGTCASGYTCCFIDGSAAHPYGIYYCH